MSITNTKSLERFAATCRTRLMGAVSARLDMALAPGSNVRVDEPGAMIELQHQLDAQGRDAVVEQYAYRWFNRIIALRYMDVMDFTATPVVSPVSLTNQNGMPGILAAAKRGEYDPDVFDASGTGNGVLRRRVQALLDNETGNPHAQADAYGLLIQAACRYWHRFMPFMFPDTNAPAGRVDELLMPPDLLAEGSVLRNAIEVMTPEACGVDEMGGNVEIIGWLYQFYIAERKDEVMAGFGDGLKADADTIPAATQLFTPDWIVRYLVQNSVGRLWMQNHPESTLADGWEYYIQPTEDADGDMLRIDSPEDLTVCDPACGSGHMLTYAFDLLAEIYEEQGYAPNKIPGLILEHNLFGMEIDERAADLAAFALTMKARAHYRRFFRRQVMPHICQIKKEQFTPGEVIQLNDLFDVTLTNESWNTYAQADMTGSLIQPDAELSALTNNLPSHETNDLILDESLHERGNQVLEQTRYVARQYAAVVANPPYMTSTNMGRILKEYVQEHYPSFEPDGDNVIPLCGDGYFEDDITTRFRAFLAAAFGNENLERNLAFIEEILGKSIGDYFVKDFYNDHVRMYSNRPIYWQYSSRTDSKGAFKALMYVHRYTPSTMNKVLEYLRDYTTHLQRQAELLDQSDRAADKRRAERLRKAVSECRAYEDQVLYPLAARNLPMDLDDGVAVNYLRMGQAVCKITSIEGIRTKIRKKPADWTWPHYPVGM